MTYTNRHMVQHKKNRIDLNDLNRMDIENLRTQINLDLTDIQNQIDWARSDFVLDDVPYDRGWMKSATQAAKIKTIDIEKIDDHLKGMPYEKDKTVRDIADLIRVIRQYFDQNLPYESLMERMEALEKEYGNG